MEQQDFFAAYQSFETDSLSITLDPFFRPQASTYHSQMKFMLARDTLLARFLANFDELGLFGRLRAGKINHECSPRNLNTAQRKATTCCGLEDTLLELHFASSSDLKLICLGDTEKESK